MQPEVFDRRGGGGGDKCDAVKMFLFCFFVSHQKSLLDFASERNDLEEKENKAAPRRRNESNRGWDLKRLACQRRRLKMPLSGPASLHHMENVENRRGEQRGLIKMGLRIRSERGRFDLFKSALFFGVQKQTGGREVRHDVFQTRRRKKKKQKPIAPPCCLAFAISWMPFR